MKPPPSLQAYRDKGDAANAKDEYLVKYRGLRSYLAKLLLLVPTAGTGIRVQMENDGPVWSVAVEEGPLTVTRAGFVVPGTICGLTPTIEVDSSDVPLSDLPPPPLPLTGTGTEHVVANFHVTLSKSADDEFVRACSFDEIKITVASTAPSAADLSSDGSANPAFKLLLATFVGGARTLNAFNQSLWFRVCDDGSRTGTCELEMTNGPPA